MKLGGDKSIILHKNATKDNRKKLLNRVIQEESHEQETAMEESHGQEVPLLALLQVELARKQDERLKLLGVQSRRLTDHAPNSNPNPKP